MESIFDLVIILSYCLFIDLFFNCNCVPIANAWYLELDIVNQETNIGWPAD